MKYYKQCRNCGKEYPLNSKLQTCCGRKLFTYDKYNEYLGKVLGVD